MVSLRNLGEFPGDFFKGIPMSAGSATSFVNRTLIMLVFEISPEVNAEMNCPASAGSPENLSFSG